MDDPKLDGQNRAVIKGVGEESLAKLVGKMVEENTALFTVEMDENGEWLMKITGGF